MSDRERAGPRPRGRERGGDPVFPGFAEIAARRHELAGELTARRQASGLSQTEVAARMGTSQSAVARLESGEADVRLSTLERYAAALDQRIGWRLERPETKGTDRHGPG